MNNEYLFSANVQRIENHSHVMYLLSDEKLDPGEDIKVAFERLSEALNQYTAVLIEKYGEKVLLRRSITSSFNLYYGFSSENNVIISDTLPGVRKRVPQDKRSPSDSVSLQYLLFRTTVGSNTFSRGVSRVEHGEEVRFTGGELSRNLFDRRCLEPPINDNRSLVSILKSKASSHRPGDSALSFSGGVDSMILASIFCDHDLLFSDFTAPEFKAEYECAAEGAKSVGRTLNVFELKEEQYFTKMQELTYEIGYPVQASLMVPIGNLIELAGRDLIIGLGADIVFGLKMHHPSRSVSKYIRRIGSQVKGYMLRGETFDFSRLASDDINLNAVSVYNLANSFADSRSIPMFKSIFGEEAVNRAYQSRVEYVLNRAQCSQSSDLGDQMELGHYINFFCGDSLSCWREVARASGGKVVVPFSDFDVFNFSRTIPKNIRYVKHGELKWILKDIVKERIPGYDASQRKLGGSIPNRRLSTEGRFGIVDQDYGLPKFLSQPQFERIRTAGFRPSWSVHSLALALKSVS